MSRAIKFRVWKMRNGKMRRYVYTPFSFMKYAQTHMDEPVMCYSDVNDIRDFMPDADIIEQYTGLKDKNGKEICEGDIFRNVINGGTWRVYWNEKNAAFWVDSGVAGCSLGEFDWDRSNRKYGFIRKNCEIIGNIHENPKLLGGGE